MLKKISINTTGNLLKYYILNLLSEFYYVVLQITLMLVDSIYDPEGKKDKKSC